MQKRRHMGALRKNTQQTRVKIRDAKNTRTRVSIVHGVLARIPAIGVFGKRVCRGKQWRCFGRVGSLENGGDARKESLGSCRVKRQHAVLIGKTRISTCARFDVNMSRNQCACREEAACFRRKKLCKAVRAGAREHSHAPALRRSLMAVAWPSSAA